MSDTLPPHVQLLDRLIENAKRSGWAKHASAVAHERETDPSSWIGILRDWERYDAEVQDLRRQVLGYMQVPDRDPNQSTTGDEAALVEVLADAEHASWAGWMDYLFSKCDALADVQGPTGALILPEWAVERWKRQAATPYADLSEQEKESDRDEVRKILPAIRGYVAAQRSSGRGATQGAPSDPVTVRQTPPWVDPKNQQTAGEQG